MKYLIPLCLLLAANAYAQSDQFCSDVKKCQAKTAKHKKYNLTPWAVPAAGAGAGAGAKASASANASATAKAEPIIIYRDAPRNTIGVFGLIPTAKAQTVVTSTSANANAAANASAANCSPPQSASDSNSGAQATTSTTTNQLNNPALGLMYEHRFGAVSGMVGATLQSSPTVLVGVGFNF